MPVRCSPSACVYGGLVAAFLPKLIRPENHRVLTRVMLLLERSSPFKCGNVSNTRPGMPVSVRSLPFSRSEFPPTVETAATPAKVSACSEVMLLLERSRYCSCSPWKTRIGRVSSRLSDKSKCLTLVRYSKSSQSSDVSFADAGNVLPGFRLKT